MLNVKDRFDEIFEIEIEGWCYGLQNYPGEIFPALVHAIVKELAPTYRAAIEHHLVFNVLDTAHKISRAAKYLVHEKEVAFSILAQIPNPTTLNEDEQFVLAQVVDQVEQAYGGALMRLQKKWNWEKEQRTGKEKKLAA